MFRKIFFPMVPPLVLWSPLKPLKTVAVRDKIVLYQHQKLSAAPRFSNADKALLVVM